MKTQTIFSFFRNCLDQESPGEFSPILKLRHRLIPRGEIERIMNQKGDE